MKLIHYKKTKSEYYTLMLAAPKEVKEVIKQIFTTTFNDTVLLSYKDDLYIMEKLGDIGEYTKTQIKYHPLAKHLI